MNARVPFKAVVFVLETDEPGTLGQQGWCCLTFAFHASGEQAAPLFSMFLLNDFPPGGLTGALIICLRKMKG